jgi:dsRNA-specific ribonuclease
MQYTSLISPPSDIRNINTPPSDIRNINKPPSDIRNINTLPSDECGQMFFNPYNTLNVEIQEQDVIFILSSYNVPISKINNLKLYKRAFVHRSYVRRPNVENEKNNITIETRPMNCLALKTKSNERLEFLGDGILEAVIKFYLYYRFPKENEGFMTEKKIALVNNEHIGQLSKDIGLHKWFIISRHAEDKHIRTNLKKLGCLFESFVGALFLDANNINIDDEDNWFSKKFRNDDFKSSQYLSGPGFQIAMIFIINVIEKHVNWTNLIIDDDNFKNILQVKIQKEFKVTPTYLIIDENEDGFTMGVYLVLNKDIHNIDVKNASPVNVLQDLIRDKNKSCFIQIGNGKHKIKKKAEQIACKAAIKSLDKYYFQN